MKNKTKSMRFGDKATTVSRDALRCWMRERRKSHFPLPPKNGYDAFIKTWWSAADFSLQGEGVWWLGHSTTLVRLKDHIILTDPIFSMRASPVSFAGPKRRTLPAAHIADLPVVDVIVISHNHYDHLDAKSLRQLVKRFPAVTIFVPLGLKRTLQRFGAKNVIELDWWEQKTVNGITYHCVPAQHWSQRSLKDRNQTLWCGWVMQTAQKTAYFMGDTGYCESLFEIGRRFDIDMAMIPIGAYAPRWFMQDQHIDPEQAVQLFLALRCKKALAIHWATFELADESLDEPPELLRQSRDARAIAAEDFSLSRIGEFVSF